MNQKQLGVIAVSLLVVVGIGLFGVVAGVPLLDDSGDSENSESSNGGETTSGDESTAADETVVFDQETPLEIDPTGTVISGTAPVEQDVELEVIAQSRAGADVPYFLIESTTVGEDGTFSVEMTSANELEAGADGAVQVLAEDEESLAEVNATIVESSEEDESDSSADPQVAIDSPAPEDEPIDTGETAEITLSLADTDSATVTLGALEEQNVRFSATVTDEDDSGEATVRFDTGGFVGADNGFSSGDGTALEETTGEYDEDLEEIDEGVYDLVVSPGDDPYYDGSFATDRSVVKLSDS